MERGNELSLLRELTVPFNCLRRELQKLQDILAAGNDLVGVYRLNLVSKRL